MLVNAKLLHPSCYCFTNSALYSTLSKQLVFHFMGTKRLIRVRVWPRFQEQCACFLREKCYKEQFMYTGCMLKVREFYLIVSIQTQSQ